MYEKGRGGLTKDDVQAVNWYRKGAAGGNSAAMYNLAKMYRAGRGGLPKDVAEASNWSRIAAAARKPDAVTILKSLSANE
jgi:TPR repeat protein